MKLVLLIAMFFIGILHSYGQNKKYGEKLNTDLTIDSFYHKIFTDSVFAYSNNSFVSLTLEYYKERGLIAPNGFSNLILCADGIYRNYSVSSESVSWSGVYNKPTTTSFLSNSTNKNFVTDAQATVISNTSGTNSGDNAVNSNYANDYRAANFVAGTNYLTPNGNGSQLTGLTKAQVGLANADNTSDANKPVSSATQTALNLKANLASPTFTGTVSGITASMVGLGNVNNTNDASKPISTAAQTALDGKQATLVSATNIKTVNGNTLLGSGDLVVGGGAITTSAGVGASPTASSTQTITHNLGRTPNTIRIYGYGTFTSNAAATATTSSMGVFNGSGNFCVYQRFGAAITTTQAGLSSNTFAILLATGGGSFVSGVIQNVTSTQFDIVWTETGTATAQVYLWEAQ